MLAIFLEQVEPHANEQSGTQYLKYIDDIVAVGRRFLDNGSGFGKARCRSCANIRDFSIDRADTEVTSEPDPSRRAAIVGSLLKRGDRCLQRDRIARMASHFSIQHECNVSDRTSHWPIDGEHLEGITARAVRHSSRARAQTNDGAKTGRGAQRAAEVRAGTQPRHAGGERHGGAARRATTRQCGVPRINGLPKHFIEGIGAGAEFRRVGFTEKNSAAAAQMLHRNFVTMGNMVGEYRRAKGGAHARHLVQVLDHDWQTGEPTRPGIVGMLERFRLLARFVET